MMVSRTQAPVHDGPDIERGPDGHAGFSEAAISERRGKIGMRPDSFATHRQLLEQLPLGNF
jgi:hypothetical protein